jgi:hypothetical protein
MLIICRLAIFTFCLTCSAFAFSASVAVYVYHDDAPFFIQAETDLSEQWVAAFNQKQTEIELKLQRIKRPELNAIVETHKPYLILWANQLWFKHRDKGVLSSDPIFWDADTLVSSQKNAIKYHQATDLEGLNIGVREGHFYSDLAPLFKAGFVHRVDAKSSFQNYEKLKTDKVDAFIDSRSTIIYMQKQKTLTSEFYVSITPQDAFSRNVLASEHYEAFLPLINKTITAMKKDKAWQDTMSYWGLRHLVDQFELELKELNEI